VATVSAAERVALVTGASSGIGRATARVLARRGLTVVAVARRAELLDQVVAECRADAPRSFRLVADLGVRGAAERVVDETVARCGRLDVLVNNAGVSKHKQIWHTTAEEAEAVLRVNFLACVWTTFAALPHMLRQGGGTIVNVSSFAAVVVPPREAVYAASKAALNAFSEGLWGDLEGSGIHVGVVSPGPIDTEIWDKEDEPPAFDGRKYPPEIVADAVFEVIERRRHEITVPRRNLQLGLARALRRHLPGLLRFALRRMEPVPLRVVEAARERAQRGLRLGHGVSRE
jgi:short-subunit dehydrogenase